MNDPSSAELEREAEIARAKMADTAETIRKKLTAGQLIDEMSGMLTGGDLAGGLNNLKHQVRDNPLPVALVGAGLAWLAFGKGMSAQAGTSSAAPPVRRSYGGASGTSAASASSGSMMSSVTDGARSVADGARSVADSAKAAAGSVSSTVGDMTDSLTETADRLRHSMLSGSSHASQRVTGSASRLLHEEPLVIAALGVALGAAVGAMLPASEFEKEQLGPYAGRLRDGAKDALDKGLDSAGTVASKAYDALKDEADRQGLTPGDGKSVGERVGEVVKSAARSAEEATREELGDRDMNSTDDRTP